MTNDIEVTTPNLEENRIFNLENQEDIEQLAEELEKGSMYFKPLTNVNYKFSLTSSNVRELNKTFNGEEITKYELSITAKGSDKTEFTGVWEVGRGVLKQIYKDYEENAVFNLKKTGSGQDTKYAITKDF
jgi:hypothetical protein